VNPWHWLVGQPLVVIALVSLFLAVIALTVAMKQSKQSQQANTFATLTTIHQVMYNDRNQRIRRYLLTEFSNHLADAVENVLSGGYLTNANGQRRVSIQSVLETLEEDSSKLDEFNERLGRSRPVEGKDVSILEAVEFTLTAFDLIAVPVYLKNKAAKEAAWAYWGILDRTSRDILPFVAIQKQLRGCDDKVYKIHYLQLLKIMNISLQGLAVPSR